MEKKNRILTFLVRCSKASEANKAFQTRLPMIGRVCLQLYCVSVCLHRLGLAVTILVSNTFITRNN